MTIFVLRKYKCSPRYVAEQLREWILESGQDSGLQGATFWLSGPGPVTSSLSLGDTLPNSGGGEVQTRQSIQKF